MVLLYAGFSARLNTPWYSNMGLVVSLYNDEWYVCVSEEMDGIVEGQYCGHVQSRFRWSTAHLK